MPRGREHDNDFLTRKSLQDGLNSGRQVAITRYKDGCVKIVIKSITQQLRGDIHICHFLFVVFPLGTAFFASRCFF